MFGKNKVLYRLTKVEQAELRVLATIVNQLNGSITQIVQTIAVRERIAPEDNAAFDGQLMAFVRQPAPAAKPAPVEKQ